MTVADLYRSVAQLGFEDSLEYEDGFVFAANRALLEVNSLRPTTSFCFINHRPMKNKLLKPTFDPVLKEDELTFECADVKAYYFECDGTGTAYIELYDKATRSWQKIGMRSISSDGEYKPYKGFIQKDGAFVSGTVRLRFTGAYLYSVKSVAMYEHLYSKAEDDIPAYEAFTKYDVSKMVSDFLSFKNPPIEVDDGYRHLNQGYQVEDNRILLLPYDDAGHYKVIYNRRPKPIKNDGGFSEDLTVIDLDEELCALLPILIAAYIWMDDEPEKAQYYLSLYQSRAAYMLSYFKNPSPVNMRSVNGW